jgi:hypothetical protein
MLDWACLSFIKTVSAGSGVPKEIADKEDFTRLLPRAIEVRIVRAGDSAKVKLRTRDALYTFKTTSEEADSLTKGTKVPIQELGQTK